MKRQFILDDEKRKKVRELKSIEQQEKLRLLEEKELYLKQKSKEIREKRTALKRAIDNSLIDESKKESTEVDLTGEDISEIFDNIDDVTEQFECSSKKRKKRKKAWNKRPDCWMDIAKHYEDYGLQSTLHVFQEEFQDIPEDSRVRNIRLWVQDKLKGKTPGYMHRAPEYGWDVDSELYSQVMEKILLWLSVDSVILREMLLSILSKRGLMKLVINERKFGQSWAARFFNRHRLRSRAVTTKMRDEIATDSPFFKFINFNCNS
jgi:hypothetical protein